MRLGQTVSSPRILLSAFALSVMMLLASAAFLLWPIADTHGQPCGNAFQDPPEVDDAGAHLDICLERAAERKDLGSSFVTFSLIAVVGIGARSVLIARRSSAI
jgi:hypothetical protein